MLGLISALNIGLISWQQDTKVELAVRDIIAHAAEVPGVMVEAACSMRGKWMNPIEYAHANGATSPAAA